jgi:hypothetical protein
MNRVRADILEIAFEEGGMEPKQRDWGRDEVSKCFAIREKVGGREGI